MRSRRPRNPDVCHPFKKLVEATFSPRAGILPYYERNARMSNQTPLQPGDRVVAQAICPPFISGGRKTVVAFGRRTKRTHEIDHKDLRFDRKRK
jgi:hypothetical protein